VVGIASTNKIRSGSLKGARRWRACSRRAEAETSPRRTTATPTRSPRSASGTPTTRSAERREHALAEGRLEGLLLLAV
jgi:hypothetical protein